MERALSPIMDVEELAAYLKRPKSYIYKLTSKGAIPTCSNDRQKRFHKEQIDAWLDSLKKPAEEPVSLSRFQRAKERLRSLKSQHTADPPGPSQKESYGDRSA